MKTNCKNANGFLSFAHQFTSMVDLKSSVAERGKSLCCHSHDGGIIRAASETATSLADNRDEIFFDTREENLDAGQFFGVYLEKVKSRVYEKENQVLPKIKPVGIEITPFEATVLAFTSPCVHTFLKSCSEMGTWRFHIDLQILSLWHLLPDSTKCM